MEKLLQIYPETLIRVQVNKRILPVGIEFCITQGPGFVYFPMYCFAINNDRACFYAKTVCTKLLCFAELANQVLSDVRNENFEKFVGILLEAGESEYLKILEDRKLSKTKSKILKDALHR